MRYAGRITGEPRDRREQTGLYDDLHATEAAVVAAFGDEEPTWWLRLGNTDSMLLAFGDVAVVARSPERGILELERIGSLAGGRYTERWESESGTLSFTHDRLPEPVDIPVSNYANERDARVKSLASVTERRSPKWAGARDRAVLGPTPVATRNGPGGGREDRTSRPKPQRRRTSQRSSTRPRVPRRSRC